MIEIILYTITIVVFLPFLYFAKRTDRYRSAWFFYWIFMALATISIVYHFTH